MITAAIFHEYTTSHVGLSNPTVMTFDTTKLSTGSTANNQVKIPVSNYFFNPFIISWGDGSSDIISTWNSSLLTHTYVSSGVYQIEIIASGSFSIAFSNTGDRLKIMNLLRFGQLILNQGSFYGCANLDLNTVNDVPIINSNARLNSAFQNSSSLTMINKASQWDVSLILTMNLMFTNATLFNQDISMWNFNKDVILTNFMTGKSSANYNATYYDALLIKWASIFIGTGRTAAKTAGMGSIKYTSAGASARAALVADGWTITDGGII